MLRCDTVSWERHLPGLNRRLFPEPSLANPPSKSNTTNLHYDVSKKTCPPKMDCFSQKWESYLWLVISKLTSFFVFILWTIPFISHSVVLGKLPVFIFLQVKMHQFFDSMEWDNLLRHKAQFIPQLDNEEDTSYFDRKHCVQRWHCRPGKLWQGTFECLFSK